MIIFGKANQKVKKYVGNKPGVKTTKFLFQFDEKGEYHTNNKDLIRLMKAKGYEVKERSLDDIPYNTLRGLVPFSTKGMKKKKIMFTVRTKGLTGEIFKKYEEKES